MKGDAFVATQQRARIVGDVERRIRDDEVGLEVGVLRAEEGVGGGGAEVGFDAVDGEVHVCQPPRRRVGLLTEDGNVGLVAAVGFGELFGLHEHSTGTTRGIVDAPSVGFEHLDQHTDHGTGRVEFAAELPFGGGEFAKEVFVDLAERIAGLVTQAFEADAGDEIDQPGHLQRVDAPAGVVERELGLEVRVVPLHGKNGIVDERGDVGAGGLILQIGPARLGRHPEDALGGVFVA